MILSHFCKQRTLVPQRPGEQYAAVKPRGLWLSDEAGGDGWVQYVERHWPARRGTLRWRHDFKVDMDRVRHLPSEDAILAFTSEYAVRTADARIADLLVDWRSVAEDYAGVVASPFVWSMRLDYRARWYYGWDVACGCIWEPGALTHLGTEATGLQGVSAKARARARN